LQLTVVVLTYLCAGWKNRLSPILMQSGNVRKLWIALLVINDWCWRLVSRWLIRWLTLYWERTVLLRIRFWASSCVWVVVLHWCFAQHCLIFLLVEPFVGKRFFRGGGRIVRLRWAYPEKRCSSWFKFPSKFVIKSWIAWLRQDWWPLRVDSHWAVSYRECDQLLLANKSIKCTDCLASVNCCALPSIKQISLVNRSSYNAGACWLQC